MDAARGAGAAPRLTIQSAAAMAASLGLQVEIVGNAGGSSAAGGEWGPSGRETWGAEAQWAGDAARGAPGEGQWGVAYAGVHNSATPFYSAYPPSGSGSDSSHSGLGGSAHQSATNFHSGVGSTYQSRTGPWEQEALQPGQAGLHTTAETRQPQGVHSVRSGHAGGVPGVQQGGEMREGRAAEGDAPQDPGPPLVDEDWASQVTWNTDVESSWDSGGAPDAMPAEPGTVPSERNASGTPGGAALLGDFPQGSFRARVSSAEAFEAGYGVAQPLACSHLDEGTPAIRPSRLGICPGHASQQSSDTHFVPICGRRGGSPREQEEREEAPGSGHEGGVPGEPAAWEWEAGEVDGAAVAEAIQAAHASFSTDAVRPEPSGSIPGPRIADPACTNLSE